MRNRVIGFIVTLCALTAIGQAIIQPYLNELNYPGRIALLLVWWLTCWAIFTIVDDELKD